ncbi:Zinc finger protein 112like, partial [Caligus rogercresseyi]
MQSQRNTNKTIIGRAQKVDVPKKGEKTQEQRKQGSFRMPILLKIYLDIHVRRHLGIKKSYVCPQCSKSFLSNADLKAHAFTHSGERPFACDVCGKRFIKKSHLEIHSRVHTGEKPHLCSECGTSFASHSTLIDHHKRRHLQFRPHRCPSCRKDFFSKHELSAHVLIHSGKKPFSCSLCEKNFNRLHHLKRHKAALHKDEMEAMQAEEVDDDVGNPEVHESI